LDYTVDAASRWTQAVKSGLEHRRPCGDDTVIGQNYLCSQLESIGEGQESKRGAGFFMAIILQTLALPFMCQRH